MQPAIIFGAGKTGRGLAAVLCARSGIPFVCVDRDTKLIQTLQRSKSYPLHVLGGGTEALSALYCAHTDSDEWHADFARTELCFTAVFGNNLAALGAILARALVHRRHSGNLPNL